MGDLSDLRKARALFAYIHNVRDKPVSGQKYNITEDPFIHTNYPKKIDGSDYLTSYRAGIDLICSAPSTSGAGGILIAAQVKRFIRWKAGFISQSGWKEEYNYIFVSVPILAKIPGPRMALMAITPAYLKAIPYSGMVVNYFKKMREIENIMTNLINLKKGGYSQSDLDAMIKLLNLAEEGVNNNLRNLMETTLDNMASRLDKINYNSGFVVGSRYA